MNFTCKAFWDDTENSLAVTFIDDGNCDVATVYYRDKAVESLGVDVGNWIANNGIMSWPGWQNVV